ncbi:hypothetical protein TSMEX_009157 [Taenia solium]|eukprot:TsM_000666600 transcript=TsM_000666600 gene=TsM_000666600
MIIGSVPNDTASEATRDAIVKVFKKDLGEKSKEESKGACSKPSKGSNFESAGSSTSSGHAADCIRPK